MKKKSIISSKVHRVHMEHSFSTNSVAVIGGILIVFAFVLFVANDGLEKSGLAGDDGDFYDPGAEVDMGSGTDYITPLADLVITEASLSGNTLTYKIKNQGEGEASFYVNSGYIQLCASGPSTLGRCSCGLTEQCDPEIASKVNTYPIVGVKYLSSGQISNPVTVTVPSDTNQISVNWNSNYDESSLSVDSFIQESDMGNNFYRCEFGYGSCKKYYGFCLVSDGESEVSFESPDEGNLYVKKNIGFVTPNSETRFACNDVFNELIDKYCTTTSGTTYVKQRLLQPGGNIPVNKCYGACQTYTCPLPDLAITTTKIEDDLLKVKVRNIGVKSAPLTTENGGLKICVSGKDGKCSCGRTEDCAEGEVLVYEITQAEAVNPGEEIELTYFNPQSDVEQVYVNWDRPIVMKETNLENNLYQMGCVDLDGDNYYADTCIKDSIEGNVVNGKTTNVYLKEYSVYGANVADSINNLQVDGDYITTGILLNKCTRLKDGNCFKLSWLTCGFGGCGVGFSINGKEGTVNNGQTTKLKIKEYKISGVDVSGLANQFKINDAETITVSKSPGECTTLKDGNCFTRTSYSCPSGGTCTAGFQIRFNYDCDDFDAAKNPGISGTCD